MIKTVHTGADIERLIVTGMIVSGTYLQRISKIFNQEYFQIDYAKTIAGWCLEYLRAYGTAPQQHIEDLFKSRRRELQDGQGALAEEFLRQLSKAHEERESFNSDYLYEKTRTYFHQRALLLMTEKVERLALGGKLPEAQQALKNFKTITTDISPWINPLDELFISSVFSKLTTNRLFQFPGGIGELIGPLERGWLVGWLGPMKRGKTFWLFECAIRAAMSKLNTVIVSLEMNEITNAIRIYRRMTSLPDAPGEYLIPIFDCLNNQDGSCEMAQRTNDIPLFDPRSDEKRRPKFSPRMGYRACTWCRGNPQFTPAENPYVVDTWYKVASIDRSLVIDDVRCCKKQFLTTFGGSRIRLRPYPAFSASINDLEGDLEILEYTEGFIPDVIVIDYADILIPPDKRLIERSALDSICKGLKGMAERRNCLVITASQSNRTAIQKDDVEQTDVAEDIRKIAHVDCMFGLNQKKSERTDMIMRVNVLAHRHRQFSDYRQALVLNQLDLGLPCIDSEIITKRNW